MLIGAIADDLTGATDLGLMFARAGLRVVQCVGVPQDPMVLREAQAGIIALKSRTTTPAAAVSQSLEALAALRKAGAERFLFKYCSTFDSTDEGNIGPVTDALMRELGVAKTIACPALPENGRTVYQGHLFVGSDLLSDSPMKDHPLTPMREASLVLLLQRQTRRPVSLVSHHIVARGGRDLEAAISTGEGIAIVDAIDVDDLLRIGAAGANLKLVTGGSGIGFGLAANIRPDDLTAEPLRLEPTPGRAAILAGSCSHATQRQIARAVAAKFPMMRVTPAEISEGTITVDDAIAFAGAQSDAPPIICSSASPEDVTQAHEQLGVHVAGAIIEDFLAQVALKLVDGGFTRLVVAGGETAGAVTQALGATTLTIGREIDPGVPWTSFRRDDRTIALALKSGNFGADDFLIKAWDALS